MGAVLLVVLAASAGKILDYYEKSQLQPGVELQQSLDKMTKCKSYRYNLYSGFTVDGRKEVISEVAGEKEQENTHIKGEMVNTPIDIYYLDRTIYNYDSFSSKWLVIESGTSNSEELLISELNPLANFRFKTVNQVEKVKFEEVDGSECLLVKCNPSVESQLLESLWKDFEYRLWIDYKKDLIRKAAMTATNRRNDKTQLEIRVEFSDFDKEIKITAPERNDDTKTRNKK
jgi:hypothetical protein